MLCQVRKALFDILQSFEGGDPSFLEDTRWLDLFAGTGSVGLEALSRGAAHCQFIELDSWVVSSVLGPNIESCSSDGSTMVHTGESDFACFAMGAKLLHYEIPLRSYKRDISMHCLYPFGWGHDVHTIFYFHHFVCRQSRAIFEESSRSSRPCQSTL